MSSILNVDAVKVWLFTQNADGTLSPANLSSLGVSTFSGDGNIITNSNSAGNVTLSIAGTSGGIPYFSSNSAWVSSGVLTANSPILGGGAGAAPKTAAFLTTDGLTQLNIGPQDSSNNGVLGLKGMTSGIATLTAPAVAGTRTNPIIFSNAISVATDGAVSTPNIEINSANHAGFYWDSANIGIAMSGIELALFTTNGTNSFLRLGTSGLFTWASTASPHDSASDTGFSRISAAVVGVGNGSAGDYSGTIQATGFNSGGTPGVSAGSFSTITAITSKAGIITQLTGTSDERLKDAQPYEVGLSAILAINPAKYFWNEKGQEHTGLSGDKEYVGFIAQDVQKAIPEAITATEKSKDGTEEYLSLDDRPIIAALVNAVKELTARIKVLEAERGI